MHFNVLMYFCRSADLPEHAFKVAMKELKVGNLLETSKKTIILFVVPPTFCMSIVVNFSWERL